MSGADTGETERRRDIIYIYIYIQREREYVHACGGCFLGSGFDFSVRSLRFQCTVFMVMLFKQLLVNKC